MWMDQRGHAANGSSGARPATNRGHRRGVVADWRGFGGRGGVGTVAVGVRHGGSRFHWNGFRCVALVWQQAFLGLVRSWGRPSKRHLDRRVRLGKPGARVAVRETPFARGAGRPPCKRRGTVDSSEGTPRRPAAVGAALGRNGRPPAPSVRVLDRRCRLRNGDRRLPFALWDSLASTEVLGRPLVAVGNYEFVGGPAVFVGDEPRGWAWVSIGLRPTGFVAIGVVPAGVIALGLVPQGVVSVGMVAIGLLPFGCSVFGLVSYGMVSFGWISFGRACVGWYALGDGAMGAYAWGNQVARGFLFARRRSWKTLGNGSANEGNNGREQHGQ